MKMVMLLTTLPTLGAFRVSAKLGVTHLGRVKYGKERKKVYKKTIILAIILGAMGTHAFADPTITVSRTPGTYPTAPFSGEFTLTPNGELMAITGETGPFPSFCVEVHETLGPFAGSTYNVWLNDEAILGNGRWPIGSTYYPGGEPAGLDGGDLLDPRTAYLYTQFRALTLIGYDYTPGPGREASALALQTAIWYLEYEYGYTWDTLSPEGRAFVALADTAYAGGWTTIGNVRVLNMLNELNNKLVAQDLLVMVPPPPPPECHLEVTKEGCVITSGGSENQCYKGNKVKSMILEYTGDGCGASSHSQESKKVKCSGDPSSAALIDIFVTDKKRQKNWGVGIGIPIGGHVLVDAANEGKDKLDSDILVIISEPIATGGDILQEVQFHTSCSQPLSVGDQFGSMRLISLTTTEGGKVGSEPGPCITEIPATGADVEYTYTITNTGPTTVTNVDVTDLSLGPVGTILSIAPGESEVLTLSAYLSEATENTVVVTAAEGCEAQATATITKAEEPPPEQPPSGCTTKVQAMLLKYIGPDISGTTTVEFSPNKKGFTNKPIVYTFGGLSTGTVLSSVTENDWTVDSLVHGTDELGNRVSIRINGIEEKIHTSCSAPFVKDQPAPLDGKDIKGNPSPNWFVVDFQQK